MERCDNCRFFLAGYTNAKAFSEIGGMCRRYAPTGPAIMHDSGSTWQIFPPMSPSQWCGDYRPLSRAAEGIAAAA